MKVKKISGSEWLRKITSGHEEWTCRVNMKSEHEEWTWRVNMKSEHEEWTWRVNMKSEHEESKREVRLRSSSSLSCFLFKYIFELKLLATDCSHARSHEFSWDTLIFLINQIEEIFWYMFSKAHEKCTSFCLEIK